MSGCSSKHVSTTTDEVWVDGECNQDRGTIRGFNVPQRDLVAGNASPGERYTIAFLAANGPLGAPGGTVFVRYAKQAFEWTTLALT